MRALSSWLEKLDEESQTVDLNFLSHDHIAGMLQPIKAELDSCKGCWEEGINRMDKLLKQTPVIGIYPFREFPRPDLGTNIGPFPIKK